jgi:hypothetical protein
MSDLKKERMSRKAFESLPEYSLSNPTGTIVGKVWRRDTNWHRTRGPEADWIVCEYVSHPNPDFVGIDYRTPEIVDE